MIFRPVDSNATPEGRAQKPSRRAGHYVRRADARISERLNHLQTTREGTLRPLDGGAQADVPGTHCGVGLAQPGDRSARICRARGSGAVKIWTISNQKGGVGKTTTAVSLGGLLAEQGQRVLLLDLDPQGSLTSYFRRNPDDVEDSVYSLFAARANDNDSRLPETLLKDTGVAGLSLMPASTAMATLDRQLGARGGMGLVISQALVRLQAQFDYVLMDCPPMLGVLMVNALAACERLLIPVQTNFSRSKVWSACCTLCR